MNLSQIKTDFENQIQLYCKQNNLNFDLLADTEKVWGIDMLKFKKTKHGENKIVLEVFGYGDNLEFRKIGSLSIVGVKK